MKLRNINYINCFRAKMGNLQAKVEKVVESPRSTSDLQDALVHLPKCDAKIWSELFLKGTIPTNFAYEYLSIHR